MKFKVICLIIVMLLLFISGCLKEQTKNQQGQPFKIKVGGKLTEVYLPRENERLENPEITANDMRKLDDLIQNFYSYARKGNRKAAVNLFLPDLRRTEDSMIPKDLELASENPDSYMPVKNSYVWYQSGKLWPKAEANALKNDEVKRLVLVSQAYKKTVTIKTMLKEGNPKRLMAVESNNKYYLLP